MPELPSKRLRCNTAIFSGRKFAQNTWTNPEVIAQNETFMLNSARQTVKELDRGVNRRRLNDALLKEPNELIGTPKHVVITHRLFKMRSEHAKEKY